MKIKIPTDKDLDQWGGLSFLDLSFIEDSKNPIWIIFINFMPDSLTNLYKKNLKDLFELKLKGDYLKIRSKEIENCDTNSLCNLYTIECKFEKLSVTEDIFYESYKDFLFSIVSNKYKDKHELFLTSRNTSQGNVRNEWMYCNNQELQNTKIFSFFINNNFAIKDTLQDEYTFLN